VIRRAQLVFCAAVVLAAVIVGTQLPLGQILGQRAAIARATAELRQLQAQNAALSSQVHALGQPANVAVIAHQQYGLVNPGQQSYVILPEPVEPGHTQSGPLSTVTIPASDLVPSDAVVSSTGQPSAPASRGGGTGFLGRVLDRLEFWRWAF
jgi:type II secretory pathway pseudopilin PulG